MRYFAPDDQLVELIDPTPEALEQIMRASSYEYWQRGGNGEASLDARPGEPKLWIRQPEPRRFFLTFSAPGASWFVPYDGGSCDALIEDESGGNPFWIPRACLVDLDQAGEIVSCFIRQRQPSPALRWCYWGDLPLPDSYPEP